MEDENCFTGKLRIITADEPKWTGPEPLPGTPPEPQPPKVTAEEAERQSTEINRRITESYFHDHEWPLIRVLNWIAFRDPTRIRDSSWRGLAYDHATRFEGSIRPKGPVENNPPKALLRALSKGKLTAARHGVELGRRIWGGVQVSDLLKNYGDTLFLRDEVLKEWKPLRSPPANAPAKTKCLAWLTDQRKDGAPKKTKSEYRDEAGTRFRIGDSQFRDLWEQAARDVPREDWGRAGRPKKSSGLKSSGQ